MKNYLDQEGNSDTPARSAGLDESGTVKSESEKHYDPEKQQKSGKPVMTSWVSKQVKNVNLDNQEELGDPEEQTK